jgi:ribosomal protein S20
MQGTTADRLLSHDTTRKGDRVKAIQPAKALLVAAVIGLGLSGGFAAAAFLPGGSAPAAISQVWDQTVGQMFGNGLGNKGSYFTAAATYIGITEAQLRAELGTDKSLADVAVAHGKTRDGLIAALTAAQQQDIATLVDQKGIGARPNPANGFGPGPGFGRGPGDRVTGDSLAAAATYLGMSEADLQTKVRAGQTLAQIANATAGKSRDGLFNALVVDATAKIDAAQKAGTITADQATQLKSNLSTRLAQLVDTTGPIPGRRGR